MTSSTVKTPKGKRRDFLYVSAAALGATGSAAALWPFIDSMNPSADVTAVSQTEVDLSSIKVGQRVTVTWQSRPVFIVRRTKEEIERALEDDEVALPDPQMDIDRVQNQEWLIVIGVCTHFGCIPLGQAASGPTGDYGGWFCPCHGSHYDTSGRIRRGPAPRNLDVPPYQFINPTTLLIG
jgi:ubiquinol-cytochrome c reductase iron-sulfur subunit